MNQVENLIFKLANEVLEATNQISARFEEGVSVLLGEIGPRATVDGHDGMFSDDQQNTAGNMEEMELDVDGMDEEEIESFLQHQMMHNSPLEGIADSVISDIVSRQVSFPSRQFAKVADVLNVLFSFRWDLLHRLNIFMHFAVPLRGPNLLYSPCLHFNFSCS